MKKFALVIVFLALAAFGGYYFYMYNSLLEEYHIMNFYDKTLVNGNVYDDDAFVFKDDRLYLLYDILKSEIDNSVYLSGSRSRIFIPKENMNIRMENSQLTNFVLNNLKTINIPLLNMDSKKFVDIEVLSKIYGFSYEYFEKYNVLFVEGRELNEINLKNNSKAYNYDGLNYFYIGKFRGDEKGYLLKSDEDYSYIISLDGKVGHIKNGVFSILGRKNFENDNPINSVRMNNSFDENFVLTWHQIPSYSKTTDLSLEEKKPIDVICPTIFSLNVEGIVINEGSIKYVQDAHEKGYKVWGLFSNSFNADWTSKLFKSEEYMNRTIAQILFYSALYNLDGINFDFENMYLRNMDDYVNYIQNACSYLKFQNIRTSLDVTVPWGSDMWSKVYDRKNLSKYVDYMCLMAYDEYWAYSKTPGPVASLPWVEKAIVKSLELIPREKLILGIPFYMRKWEVRNNRAVDSGAIGFNSFEKIKELNGNIVYDESSGQNFIEYSEDGKVYKIWIEDELSIEKRFNLAGKYKLNGVGIWSRIFANDKTWEIVKDNREW